MNETKQIFWQVVHDEPGSTEKYPVLLMDIHGTPLGRLRDDFTAGLAVQAPALLAQRDALAAALRGHCPGCEAGAVFVAESFGRSVSPYHADGYGPCKLTSADRALLDAEPAVEAQPAPPRIENKRCWFDDDAHDPHRWTERSGMTFYERQCSGEALR